MAKKQDDLPGERIGDRTGDTIPGSGVEDVRGIASDEDEDDDFDDDDDDLDDPDDPDDADDL